MRIWGDLRQDVTYALRSLGRTPAFTAAAALTVALGIGATTAIFSLANWTLLRPVPGVAHPEDVRFVWTGTWRTNTSFRVSGVSYPNLADIARRLQTVSLGGTQVSGPLNIAIANQAATHLDGEFVMPSYFDVLGVRMQRGRAFTTGEDNPVGAAQLVIISDRLWTSMFKRSESVLEQTLRVNGHLFGIIGVAPREFHGPQRVSSTDIWLPGSTIPLVNR